MEENVTKIEFLLDVFPNLSKQDITKRLNSAPPSERSTDALVAFFLAEEEKKAEKNREVPEEGTTNSIVKQEEMTDNDIEEIKQEIENNVEIKEEKINYDEQEEASPHDSAIRKSKHLIRDDEDDLDESFEVSPDPVEYSAETGKIEKSADQLQQEEDDSKLAQRLYEEELKVQFTQPNASTQPYQPTYISPYHKPPPQRPTEQAKKTNATTSNTTTSTSSSSKAMPPSKRKAPGTDTETIKKSSTNIAAQLQEVRKQREDQWRASGGKTPAANSHQRGFNAGYYNQMKEIRNKHSNDWHDEKLSQKRVWTIGDMENAAKQAHIDSGKFSAGDSTAVQVGKEALELTNKFRKENKLPPLVWHSALCNIGAQHSKNMAEHKVPFGHDGFNERIRQYPI